MTSYNCRHFPNMYYTAKEKAFCVRLYFTSKSYSFVRSMFRNEFQTRVLPSKQIICYWVSKFNSFSSLSNRFTNAGRPRSSLRKKFGDRLISRRCAIEWAPHSPDLNPPDFFLWGHLKGKVYENSPQTLQELKTSIVRQTRRITREQIRNVIDHFVRRVKICLQRGGAHLEHVL